MSTRILVVIPTLRGGGAERFCVDLITHLPDRFEIDLAILRAEGPLLTQIPARVNWHDLHGGLQADVSLVPKLARLIRACQPRIVLSIQRYANIITLLASRGPRATAVVVNEQTLPSAEFSRFGGRALKQWALRWMYPRADAIVAASHGVAKELVAVWESPRSRVRVIYNPVDVVRAQAQAAAPFDRSWLDGSKPVVIAAGRLTEQKGFDVLIQAFQIVRQSIDARLIILGEGPLRRNLQSQISSLHLDDNAQLIGWQDNPYTFFAHANVFVLSSRYEGFGIVLLDALAVGLPVVSTRCPAGPGEIITHEQNGLLVPVDDPAALADAIIRVLSERELADKLRTLGRARAQDFDAPHIARQYAELFDTLVEP